MGLDASALGACTKPQLGLPFGLALWLMAPLTWPERLKVLILPACASVLSLMIWPGWPLDVLEAVRLRPPNTLGSVALWPWLGTWSLVMWLPPLMLPMPPGRRLAALAAAGALAIPYYQQTDLLLLYTLPVGPLPLLSFFSFPLYAWQSWDGLRWLALLPLTVYLLIVGFSGWQAWQNRRQPLRQIDTDGI